MDGADLVDYYLAEEEDVERIDGVFENPLSEEQEAEFTALDDEGAESETKLPVSFHLPKLLTSRMSTMSAYGPMKLRIYSRTSRRRCCSQSWRVGLMRK